jgi:hypothetical protein
MRINEFEMRELSEIEAAQIAGGGCQMGLHCNCPNSSAYPSDDRTLLFTTDCSGGLYITLIVPLAPGRTI